MQAAHAWNRVFILLHRMTEYSSNLRIYLMNISIGIFQLEYGANALTDTRLLLVRVGEPCGTS
jgi:hypothetical protein